MSKHPQTLCSGVSPLVSLLDRRTAGTDEDFSIRVSMSLSTTAEWMSLIMFCKVVVAVVKLFNARHAHVTYHDEGHSFEELLHLAVRTDFGAQTIALTLPDDLGEFSHILVMYPDANIRRFDDNGFDGNKHISYEIIVLANTYSKVACN